MSAREISARSEGHLLWKIVDSIKGAEILRTLRDDGPKGVRQLQKSVGGSFTVIVKEGKKSLRRRDSSKSRGTGMPKF